jgi:hypothetical protein
VVTLPASTSHAGITQVLDVARALIGEADTGASRAPAVAQAEAGICDWWSRQRGSAQHKPICQAKAVRTGTGTERRWLLATALILAMAVLLALPARFSLGPNWIVPAVETLLLVAILAVDRGHGSHRQAAIRGLSCALVLILVAGAVFITVRLVADLVEGGPETNSEHADLQGLQFRGEPPCPWRASAALGAGIMRGG